MASPAVPTPLIGAVSVPPRDAIILTNVDHHHTNPLTTGQGLGQEGMDLSMGDPGCALFEFILKVVLIGLLCLLGFAGNTLSFVVLWRERSHTALTFLLQAVLLADLAVVWMLFIRDVVPGLGYVLPLLANCTTVCQHVAAVTRPLLFLARVCVVWLMLHAAVSRYLTLSRPSSLASVGTVDCARKQVILTLVTAFFFSIPLTFDSVLHVVHEQLGADNTDSMSSSSTIVEPLIHNKWYRTIYLYVVQFALLLLAPLLVIVYMTARLLQMLRSVRRLRRVLVPVHKNAQNAEMTQVVLTLCITLLVCYLPVTVLFILEWAHGLSHVDATCGHLLYYLQDFANMFLALNSSIKILIFCLFSEKFPKGVKSVFCVRRRAYQSIKNSESGFGYKCQDMSEMTLISQVDGRV